MRELIMAPNLARTALKKIANGIAIVESRNYFAYHLSLDA